MKSYCDKCGLEYDECDCLTSEMEKRIVILEQELDKLIYIVQNISNYIREDK